MDPSFFCWSCSNAATNPTRTEDGEIICGKCGRTEVEEVDESDRPEDFLSQRVPEASPISERHTPQARQRQRQLNPAVNVQTQYNAPPAAATPQQGPQQGHPVLQQPEFTILGAEVILPGSPSYPQIPPPVLHQPSPIPYRAPRQSVQQITYFSPNTTTTTFSYGLFGQEAFPFRAMFDGLGNLGNLLANFDPNEGPSGPPPAGADSIASLKEAKQEGLNQNECHICMEIFGEEDEDTPQLLTELPCGHAFHMHCAKEWLKAHCSCPICRAELPTDDADYEQYKITRQAVQSMQERP